MKYTLILLFGICSMTFTSCSQEAAPSIKKEERPSAPAALPESKPLEREEVKISKYVRLSTEMGDVEIGLYDNTPLHRDNFLKHAESGFYKDLLFHRVIKGFMVQGGDPNSKGASSSTNLGSGGPGYTVPAEFNPSVIHKKGALAAARNNNPQKESSGSQFYLVQGKVMTDKGLDGIEKSIARNMPGFTYSKEQREIYKTIGGTPALDMNYTVYGEIVKGLDVIDKIAAVVTAGGDRPVDDVKMNITIIE